MNAKRLIPVLLLLLLAASAALGEGRFSVLCG